MERLWSPADTTGDKYERLKDASDHGAFMEQSGRKRRQVADEAASQMAQTAENRCHRLRPVAAKTAW
jgi:pyruvoyl-dependent arginine decarboxylase (PvlArgDC)